MRVFVTGGTGFVGQNMVAELLRQGYDIRIVCRHGTNLKLDKLRNEFPEFDKKVQFSFGDILYQTVYVPDVLEGCDAFIHLPGIIREKPLEFSTFENVHFISTKYAIDSCKAQGIKRFLLMSALGTRENAAAQYHHTKWKAEEYVRNSGLIWTIFRPSFIIGKDGEFTQMLTKMLKNKIVPMIGNGKTQFQPVAVKNVAEGFANALKSSTTENKIYDVCGPETLSYREMVDIFAKVMGIHPIKIGAPVPLLRIMATLLDRFPWFQPTREQIIMALEGSTSSQWEEFYRDLNIKPVKYEDNLKTFLT